MTVPPALLPYLLAFTVATSVTGVVIVRDSPPTSFLSPNFNINLDTISLLVKQDRNRAWTLGAALNNDLVAANNVSSLENIGLGFLAPIWIGDSKTRYDVLVDTGSSFTFIGGNNKSYFPSASSTKVPGLFYIKYGNGIVLGHTYNDSLYLNTDLEITGQTIGAATRAINLPVDGILGLGPTVLNEGVLEGSSLIPPTVVDTLRQQDKIASRSFGVFFSPVTLPSDNFSEMVIPPGEISWGACDSTKFIGNLTTFNVTNSPVASDFWALDQTVKYGNMTLAASSGIIDTGTTMIMFSPAVFELYANAIGAFSDENGTTMIRVEDFPRLQNISFIIGDNIFELTPSAQIKPPQFSQHYFQQLSGITDPAHHLLTIMPFPSGVSIPGVDIINGYYWLQRFYTCFDMDNKQISIGITPHTFDLMS